MTRYLSTPEAAWNAQAAREQANRAMRAEAKVDALTSVIADMSRRNDELQARIDDLEKELAAVAAYMRWQE